MRVSASLPSMLVLIVMLLGGCGGGSSSFSSSNGSVSTPVPPPASPPSLARWEARMREFGEKHCALLQDRSQAFDPRLAATYYDAQWVFQRIAEYTGEVRWQRCAEAAERVYRDEYVLVNRGNVPGYWVFPHGLAEDALRSGDSESRRALHQLAHNAAFCRDNTPLESTASAEQSREVAYAILAYLQAERVGEARRDRLLQLVEQAYDHLDQWIGRGDAAYVRPFMAALTSQALIEWHQASGDGRVVPALVQAWDELWDRTWTSGHGAFMYTDRNVESGGTEPAPDLNLLIAPVFSWLYLQTGEPRFLERGDAIFRSGVANGFLDNPKQFNQSYRWSFDFLRWRQQGIAHW